MTGRASLVDEILARCTAPSEDTPVTATDVYRFAESPFAVWCARFAPETERDPENEFQRMLFERGREHERALVAERLPDAVRLGGASHEEGLRSALDAMAAGARAVHGAPAQWGALRGRFDILERRDDASSALGPWHYVVKEVKSARNLGAKHRLQAAFYHHILGRMQGYAPPAFFVINADKVETAFAFDEPELFACIATVRAIHAGALEVEPVYGHGIWPWESYTDRVAIDRRDVTLVTGVGAAMRDRLAAVGIRTVDELARAPKETLLGVRGVGETSATKFQRSARALLEGRPIQVQRVAFPSPHVEVFLDLEGSPEQVGDEAVPDVDYLIGAIVRDRSNGPGRYLSFVARTPEAEGDMWRAFLDWFATLDDFVVYHWSHYERTHLKRLATRHGIAPELHAKLFAGLRDLLADATNAYAFPTYGNSIKAIAPYLGFSWRHKSVNAMESIALYLEYARSGDVARLRLVLDYNEDDCRAMVVVKDWLAAHASAPPAG